MVALPVADLARAALRKRIAEVEERAQVTTELERCRSRFAYFLFRWCRTQDEHDPSAFAKPFPRHVYVREMADVLQAHRRIVWEKSRQMMASWICCAFVLWVAMYRPNVLAFVQSKKEEDAADRLGRIYQIYFRLPEWMKQRFPINLNSGRPGNPLYKDLFLTWRPEDARFFGVADNDDFRALVAAHQVRSRIWAIPQGGDVLRQYTGTLIFSDEAAFQVEAGAAYEAAMPTLDADAWMLFVSTANSGFFESLVHDAEVR